MRDVLVVYQKEVKELLLGSGSWRTRLLPVLVLLAMFAVIMPLQAGPGVVQVIPFFALVVPMFLSVPIAADSFAGERERGTLETILATRLPSQAIFLGKVLTTVTYTWALSLVVLLSALIIPNLMLLQRGDGLFIYPTSALLIGVVGSLLVALLAATVGGLVSLRAKSVRDAMEMLAIPLMAVVFAVGFALPKLTRLASRWLTRVPTQTTVLLILVLVAALDVGLLYLAIRRFHRGRVIGD